MGLKTPIPAANTMSLTTIDADRLPACLTRDNLTSPYFSSTSQGMLTVVATLCVLFVLTSFNRLNHTDLWGHLQFGRWIAEHRALPPADPIAAQPTDTPVLHSAWLAQIAGYAVQRWFGNEGLVFGHALLVTLAVGVMILAVHCRGVPLRFAALAGVAMYLLNLPIVGTIRPQLFGQLGAALVLLACSELPHRRHPLLWLPLVAALWANLHGSILMGLAMLGCCVLGMAWQVMCEKDLDVAAALRDPRVGRMGLALALMLAGACVNPHGPMLLSRILFFGEHAALASISEWRALTPGSLTGMLVIVSGLTAAALARFGPRRWELHEVLLLVLFGAATFFAIRMMAWWAVVWPWAVVPHLSEAWKQHRASRGAADETDEPAAMRTLIAMGCVFAAAIIAPPSYSLVTGRARGEAPISVRQAPIHLADQATRLNLAGSLAAPMDWADYFVWKTAGRVKPMIYSHVHLTRPETFADYQKIFRGEEVWLKLLHSHGIRYLVLSKERHKELAARVVAELRSGRPHLRIAYQDQRGMILELVPPKE
jgi:hypothetical protein